MANRFVNVQGVNSCSGFDISNLSNVIFSSSTPPYVEGDNFTGLQSGEYIVNTDTLKMYRSGTSLIAKGVNGQDLGTTNFLPALNSDCDYYGFAFVIDETHYRGSIVFCYHIKYVGYYANFTSLGNYESNNIYQAIIGAEQPAYNWQSVPSISGKNGISLLSIIKSSAINSGDAVTGASADAFDRLEESTKISALIQGISEETPIIYSDDVNYMSITPTANNTCTLKFYLHGNVIYTLTDVNINAYLSFLIDEANGIMKPSIIYEDS